MEQQDGGMPPIHTWWSRLSIEARHALLADPSGPLAAEVRSEIEQITGSMVPRDGRLSDEDVQFVHTQIEPID